ncbi:hypothetical protein ACFOVU_26865 [Nocardiopsis sediminis]|uniref:LppX_LprAFG lipoprotein n=1 Tax=Nocardiopsis sediminis TaxID=1778267 RepID=A0ABV8FTS1_9ACTN
MSPDLPSRRRPSGPVRFAAATAVLALGAAGCSIDLSSWRPGGGGEEPAPSPTPVEAGPLLDAALESLAAAPAIAVQGQIAEAEDQVVKETALTVTDAGATYGTVQESENEAEVVQADGRLFVNAPDEYWLDQDVANPDTDQYAGAWVRVSGAQLGINPGAVLTPATLAEILRGLAPEGGEATLENLDGTSAYRIDLGGGEENRVWIGEDSGELMRMEIEQLAPEDADSGPRTRLNFTAPEAADIETVYDDILAAAEDGLGSSRDARLPVNWEGQLALECADGGACTVTGQATDDSGAGGDTTVIIRMDAELTNEELGSQECSDSTSIQAGGTAELTCSVDFELAPSTEPQEYEISGDALLSTRGLSGDARDELVATVGEQREATLSPEEGTGSAEPSADPSAEPSASGN